MFKNFLGVKDMTLMGAVGSNSSGSQPISRRKRSTLPRRYGPIFWEHDPSHELTVDVAPKLKFNEGSKIPPW
jgi:hypothetical protein